MVSVDVDMTVSSCQFQLELDSCLKLERSWSSIHTLNDVPHPQLDFAFGLLKMNPLLTRLVS